jgi:hypothetical protein
MPFRPSLAVFHALLAGWVTVATTAAQVSFKPDLASSLVQNALPAEGPATSHSNPAALGESPTVYGHMGIASGAADEGPFFCWQFAGALAEERSGLPIRISAGLGGWWNSFGTGVSNAVSEESRIIPGLAVSWLPGPAGLSSLSLGLTFPFHMYNVFGAAKSRSNSLGLGLLAGFAPGGSSLQAGLAYHSELRPGVRFPDGRGLYAIEDWALVSLAWIPPGRWARLHWEWYFPDVRWDWLEFHFGDVRVNSWELEWRPNPIVGLKFERTRSGDLSSWGMVLRPEYGQMKSLYLEVNAGHHVFQPSGPAWLFGKAPAERSGAHAGFSLGAGM